MSESQKATVIDPEIEVMTESVSDLATIPSINRAEIDMQIATAKRYPRSITAFKRQAMEMALLDEETAASMFYVLPRAGKKIEGPSVRLAEVIGSAWGNIRYGARGLEVGARDVTAEGVCMDLEKNNACSIQIRRRIVDSKGRRYSDDMIQVTMNAACSIALRQAIFKVVPFAYAMEIYEKAKQVSVGKGLTIEQQRKKAVEALAKFKMKEADILKVMKKKGLDDLTVDDLIELRGIYTALNDGETTVAELLQEVEPKNGGNGETKSKSDRLADQLGDKKEPTDETKSADSETKEIPEGEHNTVRGVPVMVMSGKHKGKPKWMVMFDQETGYTTLKEFEAIIAKDCKDQLLPMKFTWKDSDDFGREIVAILEPKV
jgi:hypothetical protein